MYIDELIIGAKNSLKWSGIGEREQVERLAVVKEALSWLNTPYHHMGRVKGVGVDCGMFIAEVFERCNKIPHIDFAYYPSDWGMHRSEEHYLKHMNIYFEEVTRSPLPGDVLLYRFGRCVSHGSVVIFNNTLIHSYINLGVVLADRMQDDLKSREIACYSSREDK